jgi:hypothetical protein
MIVEYDVLTDLTIKVAIANVVDDAGSTVQENRANCVSRGLDGKFTRAEASCVGRHRQAPSYSTG